MFTVVPTGPFDLAVAHTHFDRWPELPDGSLAVAFPIEGWRASAAVTVRRAASGAIEGQVHGADGADAEQAWRQVLVALSLDHDGAGFPKVGERDPVIGRIQTALHCLRPICNLSPYEAAVARVLGQRSSIVQQRKTRARMAEQLGDAIAIPGGPTLHALPRPQVVRDLEAFPGISAAKLESLRGVADAALAGKLAVPRLRSRPFADVVAQLRELPGVGAWTSQGIVLRGAGVVDEVPDDETTREAVRHAYGLRTAPSYAEVVRMAEAWRPYRMWTVVLLHVWLRRGKKIRG